MSAAHSHQRDALLEQLRSLVGRRYVLTGEQQTRRFRKGHRTGEGQVLAVIQPGTLLEQWQYMDVYQNGVLLVKDILNNTLKKKVTEI